MFGLDQNNKVRDRFDFPQNSLAVTSIDIQSVEPVDQRTRDALIKSVQLAIEITTNSQEATARYVSVCVENHRLSWMNSSTTESVFSVFSLVCFLRASCYCGRHEFLFHFFSPIDSWLKQINSLSCCFKNVLHNAY